MIKSVFFKAFSITFILFLLLNSGNCVVSQDDLIRISNEARLPDTRKRAFERLGKIVLDNDENDLKTVRDLVNEMLISNDMDLINEALFFSSIHNRKLRNSPECAGMIIDIMKDDQHIKYHETLAELLRHFELSEDNIRELLDISPLVKSRNGYKAWIMYMHGLAEGGGEIAYDPIVKYHHLDNASTETLQKYEWLLIKTKDMRSINRVLNYVETMPLNDGQNSSEFSEIMDFSGKRMALDETGGNAQLFSRCLNALDNIVKDEKAHQNYIYFPCLSLTHLGINHPSMRELVLKKLEEYRPRWEKLQYGQHIEYNIKRINIKKYK